MPDYEKFEIGNKAEKLMFLILDATTNRKNYPVKFRRVSDSLQSCAINTVSCILNANNIKQKVWKRFLRILGLIIFSGGKDKQKNANLQIFCYKLTPLADGIDSFGRRLP